MASCRNGVGKLIDWPAGILLAPGNEGVAARIRLSEGSIGYVEYWFAQRLGLRMAALQNKSGAFITPTSRSGELALSARVAKVQELAVSVADPSDEPIRSRLIAGCSSTRSTASRPREPPWWILRNGASDYRGKTMALSLAIYLCPPMSLRLERRRSRGARTNNDDDCDSHRALQLGSRRHMFRF